MDELMTLHPNGLFLRREALDFGYRDEDLLAARRAGVITRVRHGAYAPAASWAAADEVERYRLRGQAVCLTHDNRVALSHASGAAEHGLRLWGTDLDRVHVVRLDGASGRRQRDVVYHEESWSPGDIVAKDEMLLLSAAQCAVGAAALTSVESGLCVLDSFAEQADENEAIAWAEFRRRTQWPHHAKLQITMRLMRRGSQSVGESRTRFLFWSEHLPEPVLQFEVRDEHGRLVGITDFAWPEHGLLGEFDGIVKYGRLLRPGQTPGDVVTAEKVREDELRELTGCTMIRFIWHHLSTPRATARRTARQLYRRKVA